MGTKIDYIALLKPLEKILQSEDIPIEKRVKMTLEVITEVLKQAETKD